MPALFMGGLVIPVLCEKLAFHHAFEQDNITPCIERPNYVCHVQFLGMLLSTSSFMLVVTIIGSIVQAVILMPLSGFADLGDHRRQLLLLFTVVGGTAACLQLVPLGNPLYSTAALAVVCALSTSAVSSYALSLVPAYAKAHSKLHGEQAAVELSSRGGAISLVCSTLVTAAAYGISQAIHDEILGLKASLALGGAWWLIVGGGSWRLLSVHQGNVPPPGFSKLVYSLTSVMDTFKLGFKLSNIFLAQFAFLLISEGTNTSGLITILIARNELNMQSRDLTVLTIASPLGCSLGIVVMLTLTSKYNLSVKHIMITMSLLTAVVISLNVIGRYTNLIGFHSKWEVITAFIVSAIFYGPVLVSFRTLLAEISPKGRECQLFTFNTLLSTGTNWIGTLAVLYIIQHSEIRLASFLSLALVLLGVAILSRIDLAAARSQSEVYAVA
ncbi:hypothetical protein DSO57_1005276 [Entomophthora muscae]|uniref:Uncharacterized protein n=1 Tax=Entomophthora muscae TaxID=34485 RepID=A0ACC2TJ74_9FUNG|nr:hypothetical protein DSO57_1005276 [Entomophthora muscae]